MQYQISGTDIGSLANWERIHHAIEGSADIEPGENVLGSGIGALRLSPLRAHPRDFRLGVTVLLLLLKQL